MSDVAESCLRLKIRGGDDSALSKQAAEYLHEGELDKAGAILDQILDREKQQVNRYAANELNRALVYELQFRPLEALPHSEASYKHSSGSLAVAAGLEYSKLLLDEKDYRRAEPVLLATVDIVQIWARLSSYRYCGGVRYCRSSCDRHAIPP